MILYILCLPSRYYGLWLWFPELFNKLNEYYKYHPDDSKTVCEIVDMGFKPPPNNTSTNTYNDDEFCNNPVPDSEVFINSIYVSIAAAPGNIWSIVHMDKLGRRFFLGKTLILLKYFVSDSGLKICRN